MKAYDFLGNEITDAQLDNPSTTFYKVHIMLNDYTMDDDAFSPNNRQHTVLHEWGHTLNLAHQPIPTNSVMVQGQLSYTAPTSVDYQNVNSKY
jgi:hypothetical protein